MNFTLDNKKEWLEQARILLSPNCDERPADAVIDLVVIHGISLPPRHYGGPYIDQLFTNRLDTAEHPYFLGMEQLKVSSHLLVDREGNITQYVPFNLRAWHAGDSEFNGRKTCNDFSIGIEFEGCDEEPYEKIQYEIVAELLKILQSNWPEINNDRIVAHADIAPGRKTDPGPAFDWPYFLSLVEYS